MAAQFVIQAVREKGTKRKNGEFKNSQQESELLGILPTFFQHGEIPLRNKMEEADMNWNSGMFSVQVSLR